MLWFSCEPRDPRCTRISSASLAPDVAPARSTLNHCYYATNQHPRTTTFQTCIVSVHHSNVVFRPPPPLPACHIFRDLKVYYPSALPIPATSAHIHSLNLQCHASHTLTLTLSPKNQPNSNSCQAMASSSCDACVPSFVPVVKKTLSVTCSSLWHLLAFLGWVDLLADDSHQTAYKSGKG